MSIQTEVAEHGETGLANEPDSRTRITMTVQVVTGASEMTV